MSPGPVSIPDRGGRRIGPRLPIPALSFALLSLGLLAQVMWLDLRQGPQQEWQIYQRRYFQQEGTQGEPQVINLTLPDGRVERCQTCHLGLEEISPSHPVEVFGCTSCHGGNGLSLDKTEAHRGLRGGGNPGDLRAAQESCGTGADGTACHSGREHPELNMVGRLPQSPMASKAGEINQVRLAFGLQKDAEQPAFPVNGSPADIAAPLDGHPLEDTFQKNCLSQCHLWGGAYGDAGRTYSGGCSACHYLYNRTGTYEGKDITIPRGEPGHGAYHRLTAGIPYTQCNACHNQGIHSLVSMTFEKRADLPAWHVAPSNDGAAWAARVREYYIPGESYARCEVSLDCIDCHSRHDTMGDPARDGSPVGNKYQAQSVRCYDCHGTTQRPPQSTVIQDPNDPALIDPRWSQPGFPTLKVGDRVGLTGAGETLPFLRFEGDRLVQYSKVTGKPFAVPLAYGSACRQDPTDQSADACHTCHDVSATVHAQPPAP